LPFECQKFAKNLTFKKKKCQKIVIFSTKLKEILLKKDNFFEKNVKFLAIF